MCLSNKNWRCLWTSAILLAQKIWDDVPYKSSAFAEILQGPVSKLMVRNWELNFLSLLQLSTSVSATLYATYYFELRSFFSEITSSKTDSVEFSMKPLSMLQARILEHRSTARIDLRRFHSSIKKRSTTSSSRSKSTETSDRASSKNSSRNAQWLSGSKSSSDNTSSAEPQLVSKKYINGGSVSSSKDFDIDWSEEYPTSNNFRNGCNDSISANSSREDCVHLNGATNSSVSACNDRYNSFGSSKNIGSSEGKTSSKSSSSKYRKDKESKSASKSASRYSEAPVSNAWIKVGSESISRLSSASKHKTYEDVTLSDNSRYVLS